MPLSVEEIQRKIIAEARRQGVDPALALGIVQAESDFNPDSVGDKGKSVGLFQLQPAAAQDVGMRPEERYDVDKNIAGGLAYFKNRRRREGDEDRGISAYNQGTGMRGGQLSNPQYVRTVRQYQREWQPVVAHASTSLLSRVRGAVTPARAEAAETGGLAPGQARPGAVDPRDALGERLFGPKPTRQAASPAASPAEGAVASPTVDPRDALGERLFGPKPTALAIPPTPGGDRPRSPALAAEQAQAAQRPWWQRGIQAAAEASPEIALMSPQLPQIEQARAEMSPAEREELRRREGSQSSAGADIGEIAGQMVGSAVLPGFGTAVGGTVGAVTGMTAETLAREGRLPTWKEVGQEAVFSALPEFAESAVRGAGRSILRRLPGGQRIRFDEAARRVRALPGLVFDPQGREEIGDAFEAVRRSGVQLDIAPLRQEIQNLRPGKYADVMAEMRRMDQAQKTGQRYQQLFQNLRQGGGTQVAGWPIGDLQQLRSGLRQRIDQLEHTEARQLLRDVQRSVDDAVDQGIARGRVGTGQTVEQLQEARRQWARLRSSEDLGDLIERTITTTPDLSMASLNLRQLADALRRNSSDLAQGVNRALDHTPGARAAFQHQIDDLAHLYRTIELPMTDVAGISRLPVVAALRQGLSTLLLTEPGQRLFRNAIVDGRGQLSLNLVAEGANAVRRELGLAPLDLFGTGAPQQTETSGAGATPPAAGR